MSRSVFLLGASSPVGGRIAKLFMDRGFAVSAVSRSSIEPEQISGITWLRADLTRLDEHLDLSRYNVIVSVAPIDHTARALIRWYSDPSQRFVGISSTSVLTKAHAHHRSDRDLANRLNVGEQAMIRHFLHATILRPTMIYFGPGDRNVEKIVRHLRRVSLFPLIGGGAGLRQPIHADDVAQAVVEACLEASLSRNTYEIAGGEVLSVKDMVRRVAVVNGLRVSFVSIPLPVARAGLTAASVLPRFRDIPRGALDRMTQDMVFENDVARQDFGFSPRVFQPMRYPR
jgi:uncharacterized protein YbjT (DUF2867 family)